MHAHTPCEQGRWLRDLRLMDDYGSFWLKGGGDTRRYTFAVANSLLELSRATGSLALPLRLLPELERNFEALVAANYIKERGLFFQTDTADGGEDSISGAGLRPTINFAMVAEQRALAHLSALAGNATAARRWAGGARQLRARALSQLWNPESQFFGVVAWPYGSHPKEAEGGGVAQPPMPPPPPPPPPPLHSRCAGAPVWPNGSRVPVRELLALSNPYYYRGLPTAPQTAVAAAAAAAAATPAAAPAAAPGAAPGAAPAAAHVDYGSMWAQLLDPHGFSAAWGPRTAERRSPHYNFSCSHECLWNAPSWPFETSRTLSALANYLIGDEDKYAYQDESEGEGVGEGGDEGAGAGEGGDEGEGRWGENEEAAATRVRRRAPEAAATATAVVAGPIGLGGFWSLLLNCTRSIVNGSAVHPADASGKPVPPHPWVSENIHPDDGHWITRQILYQGNKTGRDRGFMYNHATYCDNIISGLVGVRGSLDPAAPTLLVSPLVTWPGPLRWFALDGLPYHGRVLTVLWDADGTRYGRGGGLQVWVDGQVRAAQPGLGPVNVSLAGLSTATP